jgi:hypothetical protein
MPVFAHTKWTKSTLLYSVEHRESMPTHYTSIDSFPPADLVLTDIRVLHVTQESETERAEIKNCRGVLFNLEY